MQRGAKFWATMVAVALVSVLTALDQTVVATALPHMIVDLQGAAILGWVFTAYFLAATATVTVAGKLADLFGRRGVFLISIGIFLVGSLLCGLANSMPMLVLFRAVQGVGAGSINTMAFVVMADLFSPRERGKWQIVNNVGFASASAIGPSVGGVLSDSASWRWIFLVNVPLCLFTMLMVLYGLRETARSTARPAIDWAGALWSIVGIVAILLALTWGGREEAWTSPRMLALFGIVLAASVLLWRAERRAVDPLIPTGMLSGTVTPFVSMGFFGTFFVWFSMILLAPLRLQLVEGSSATQAGALLTPGIVLSPIAAFVAGQVLTRTGRFRPACRVGALLQVVGLAMLLFVPQTLAEVWVLTAFAVVGLGTGVLSPSLMIAFQNAIPHHRLGSGMGMASLFRQFGSSVGTTLVGAIVGSSVAIGATAEMQGAIQQAVLVQLAAGVLVVIAMWLMADVPLGTARETTGAEIPTKGAAWNRVPADH